jgi:GDSL-like Lipase/Acylhydrolase family
MLLSDFWIGIFYMRFISWSIAITALTSTTVVQAEGPITWSVANNFAIFKPGQAKLYDETLEAILACSRLPDVTGLSDAQKTSALASFQGPASEACLNLLPKTNFGVQYRARLLQYERTLSQPGSVKINFNFGGTATAELCEWQIGTVVQRGRPCLEHTATVQLETPTVIKVRSVKGQVGEINVTVRRVVIVTMGDSFQSGEGNAHTKAKTAPSGNSDQGIVVTGEQWLQSRCHSSLFSASAIASRRWAAANSQAYVVYMNFACSGATIQNGVLGSYAGIEGPNARNDETDGRHFTKPKLPSQLSQVASAICADGKGCTPIEPDVVLLSVGVNDYGFSDIVKTLAKTVCHEDCWTTLEQSTRKVALELASERGLEKVYKAISARLNPKHSLVIEYPDPTHSDDGSFCNENIVFNGARGKKTLGMIDRLENEWAHKTLMIPLNDAQKLAAAASPGWRYVDGVAALTERHGYCAEMGRNFFHVGEDANYGPGTLHPNIIGHDAIARRIGRELDAVLAAK